MISRLIGGILAIIIGGITIYFTTKLTNFLFIFTGAVLGALFIVIGIAIIYGVIRYTHSIAG